jgi:hypothetical protein
LIFLKEVKRKREKVGDDLANKPFVPFTPTVISSNPPVATPPQNSSPAPTYTHPMITRAQSNIHKPKLSTDGTIWNPLLRALTISLELVALSLLLFL